MATEANPLAEILMVQDNGSHAPISQVINIDHESQEQPRPQLPQNPSNDQS